MLVTLPDILTAAEVESVTAQIKAGSWVDGKYSAQGLAADVKRNLQLDPHPSTAPLDTLIIAALSRNQTFKNLALPRKFMPPVYSAYRDGMAYGSHIDAPIMGLSPPLRVDISVTIFLSDPATYDDGALLIETMTGEEEIKLPAGSAVAYDADTLHRVAPVTQGERLAAVTWAQSYVRDDLIGRVLFDMQSAIERLALNAETQDEALTLGRAYSSLLRRFTET